MIFTIEERDFLMPLNIIVCIKQVPDTNDMRIDPKTNNLIREGVPAVVNPTDLNAIEEALRFKDTYGANVSVLTMGPPQAEQSLREAIAMGADQAYLLTDRAFGGADTLATSYALWKAVQKIEEQNGRSDFLFFGKVAIDGETGQVGPGLSVRMGYPVVTYTSKTDKVDLHNKFIEAERRVDDGIERVKVPIPCALTITEATNEPRQPTIDGLISAKKTKINILNRETVNADPKRIGLGGSPTYVKKVVVPPPKKKGDIKEAKDPKEAAKWLVDKLVQNGSFGKKIAGGVIPDRLQAVQPVEQAVATSIEQQRQRTIAGEHGDVWVYVENRYGQVGRVAWELMGEGKRLA
ncbi:MAG: FAD-binding protein, partial [Rhabdochlamydiaceae bacterium]